MASCKMKIQEISAEEIRQNQYDDMEPALVEESSSNSSSCLLADAFSTNLEFEK